MQNGKTNCFFAVARTPSIRLHLAARVFAITLVVLALFEWGKVSILTAGQSDASLIGNPNCAQDFPGGSVVMCGLDNPRGLTLGPEGALYVAEAGRGPDKQLARCLLDSTQPQCANVPCLLTPQKFTNPAFPDLFGKFKPACAGSTGAVTRLWGGRQERAVTGLPSWGFVSALASFSIRAEGPNGVSMLGSGDAYVTVGLEPFTCDGSQPPDCVTPMRNGLGTGFGTLARVILPTGRGGFVADLAQYELENNPESRRIDSNPFGLLALPGREVIVDAGGNDVLMRDADTGETSTLAVLPNDPSVSNDGDGVPTSIAQSPNGVLYVSQLTGVPLLDGKAQIYRVREDMEPSHALEPVCTGFKAVIGLAFDRQGNLYVLEIYTAAPSGFSGPGAIFRIDAVTLAAGVDRCNRASSTQINTVAPLSVPTGIIVGPDDMLYVTNKGTDFSFGDFGDGDTPSQGEVLRIVPPVN